MKATVYLILILSILGCSTENDSQTSIALVRPDNVPNTAFWQGGKDGGAWYECIPTSNSFEYECSIFNDFTGELMIKEKFELYITINNKPQLLSEFIRHDKLTSKEINSFNGHNEIYLNGTLSLKTLQD